MTTEQRIADLQKQLDELKASLEKKEDGLWYPKLGERYYFFTSNGELNSGICHSDNNKTFLFNNTFPTVESVNKHARRLKLINKLWRLAEHLNGDWVPDFSNSDNFFYAILEYDHYKSAIVAKAWHRWTFGMPIFKSEQLAQRAISMLTDEEKEIFKNIYRP